MRNKFFFGVFVFVMVLFFVFFVFFPSVRAQQRVTSPVAEAVALPVSVLVSEESVGVVVSEATISVA